LSPNTIKQSARAFADPNNQDDNHIRSAEDRFRKSGGFVFFNEDGNVVAVKGLSPNKDQDWDYQLNFGSRETIIRSDCANWERNTLNEIWPNATEYCWSNNMLNFESGGMFFGFPIVVSPSPVDVGFQSPLYLHALAFSLNDDACPAGMGISVFLHVILAVGVLGYM
jgi:hypothetical protein